MRSEIEIIRDGLTRDNYISQDEYDRIRLAEAALDVIEKALRVCGDAYATFGLNVVVEPKDDGEVVEIDAFVAEFLPRVPNGG